MNEENTSPDLDSIKTIFPHSSNAKIRYFNTGSVGPSPAPVIKSLCTEIMRINGAMIEGKQSVPNDGSKQWQNYKEAVSQFIGCAADEIVLTRNTTEGVNIICNGFPKGQNYTLVTSSKEHVGNIGAWVNRAKNEQDITIDTFECNKLTAQECLQTIIETLNKHDQTPIILSIPHIASDGYRFPVEAIGRAVSSLNQSREHKIFYFIDGAQSLGMLDVKVKSYNCHAYAASGHKWLGGPKGTGLLYIRSDVQNYIMPQFVGAYSFNKASFTPPRINLVNDSYRYAYGTQTSQLFAGLTEAVKLYQSIGINKIEEKTLALAAYFKTQIQMYNQSQNRFEVYDLVHQDQSTHSAMVTFAIEDKQSKIFLNSHELTYKKLSRVKFADNSIYLRLRHIYEGGLDGVRASFHIFHDQSDVELLVLSIKNYLSTL